MSLLTILYTIPICNKLRCWLVRRRIAKGYLLRSNAEILNKRQQIHDAMIIAQRSKQDLTKFEAAIDILEWLTGGTK